MDDLDRQQAHGSSPVPSSKTFRLLLQGERSAVIGCCLIFAKRTQSGCYLFTGKKSPQTTQGTNHSPSTPSLADHLMPTTASQSHRAQKRLACIGVPQVRSGNSAATHTQDIYLWSCRFVRALFVRPPSTIIHRTTRGKTLVPTIPIYEGSSFITAEKGLPSPFTHRPSPSVVFSARSHLATSAVSPHTRQIPCKPESHRRSSYSSSSLVL